MTYHKYKVFFRTIQTATYQSLSSVSTKNISFSNLIKTRKKSFNTSNIYCYIGNRNSPAKQIRSCGRKNKYLLPFPIVHYHPAHQQPAPFFCSFTNSRCTYNYSSLTRRNGNNSSSCFIPRYKCARYRIIEITG